MATYRELKNQAEKLLVQAEEARKTELAAAIEDIKARMDEYGITVRDLGAGSRRISTVPVGTRVSIEGPYGLFTDAARTAPKMAIVAAGVGVTPVRALLEHATATSAVVTEPESPSPRSSTTNTRSASPSNAIAKKEYMFPFATVG